jgi:hypothetical protein
MTVPRLKKIAAVAEKFGGEFVHLSVRQSIELININFRDFDAVVAELGEGGQKVASCGARVRVPTACGGCEYNPNGLVDSQAAALEVDQTLFGTATGHHKFKVGFAGCPFDCPKSAAMTSASGPSGPNWTSTDASVAACAPSRYGRAIAMGEDAGRSSPPTNVSTADASRYARRRPENGEKIFGPDRRQGHPRRHPVRRFFENRVVDFVQQSPPGRRKRRKGWTRQAGDFAIGKVRAPCSA